ncbi:hypothetical protein ZWY2020_007141 [Hordeum vulgare]|nr:hypothetical protein ZWY2020_007141 [Hordeum vulgare]
MISLLDHGVVLGSKEYAAECLQNFTSNNDNLRGAVVSEGRGGGPADERRREEGGGDADAGGEALLVGGGRRGARGGGAARVRQGAPAPPGQHAPRRRQDATAELLASDTLRLSPRGAASRNFAVGCSLASVYQPPSGLAGFGHGAPSVPAQLRVNKFFYCLLSRINSTTQEEEAPCSCSCSLLGLKAGSCRGGTSERRLRDCVLRKYGDLKFVLPVRHTQDRT